jgi:AraC-like DNA-binding protein
MKPNSFNSLSLDENERIIPHGINHFLLSDKKGMPKVPKGVSTISPDSPAFFKGIVLGLCTQGEATVIINFMRYPLKANATVMVLPYQSFQIEAPSDDFVLENIFFSFNFFAGLVLPSDYDILFKISKQPCLKVSDAVTKTLQEYLEFINRHYDNTKLAYRVNVVRGLVYAYLLYVISLYKGATTAVAYSGSLTRQQEITANFLALLGEKYATERSVSYYADKLCISRKYLSQIIKETTNRPVMKWIGERVLNEAKLRLRTSNLSVMQISDQLNFANPSFFGQFFKRHTGTTPLKFRNSS